MKKLVKTSGPSMNTLVGFALCSCSGCSACSSCSTDSCLSFCNLSPGMSSGGTANAREATASADAQTVLSRVSSY